MLQIVCKKANKKHEHVTKLSFGIPGLSFSQVHQALGCCWKSFEVKHVYRFTRLVTIYSRTWL